MNTINRKIIGSETAKGGFANEKIICEKFNNWKQDREAQIWLRIMGYDVKQVKEVEAFQIPVKISKKDINKFMITESDYEEFVRFKKADAQIRLVLKMRDLVKIENISIKKANSDANYNQVDKRSVDDYQKMWCFNDQMAFWLKLFTGEIKPTNKIKELNVKLIRDRRRIFIDEMPVYIQKKIIKFFDENKIMIVSDLLKGRGGLSANWLMITRLNRFNNTTTWTLKDINYAMNFFGKGIVKVSPKGSLLIGRIVMQRKGGTPDPNKLQFKIRPCELFNAE